MSLTRYLKGECSHCGGRIEFPADAIGATVDCPHCGKATELMLATKEVIATTFRPLPLYVMAALMYWAFSLCFEMLQYRIERRLGKSTR